MIAYEDISHLAMGATYLDKAGLRAAQRAPGEKSVYLYDPAGNRLQIIILAASD